MSTNVFTNEKENPHWGFLLQIRIRIRLGQDDLFRDCAAQIMDGRLRELIELRFQVRMIGAECR